jgi:hypothetical protein
MHFLVFEEISIEQSGPEFSTPASVLRLRCSM